MIRNNYPRYRQAAANTLLSSRVLCLACSSSSLHPQSLITALMTVCCLSSSGSWLIIWSPTHYQTQTSSLLRAPDCRQRKKSLYLHAVSSKQGVWSISVTSLPSNLCRPVINIHCLHVQISSPGYRPSLPRDTEIRIWCLNLLGVLTIDISVSDSKIHYIPRSFHLSINNPSLAASRVSLASSFSYSCVSWNSHWQMSITSPSPISILESVICSLRCLQPPALTMSLHLAFILSEWVTFTGEWLNFVIYLRCNMSTQLFTLCQIDVLWLNSPRTRQLRYAYKFMVFQ